MACIVVALVRTCEGIWVPLDHEVSLTVLDACKGVAY